MCAKSSAQFFNANCKHLTEYNGIQCTPDIIHIVYILLLHCVVITLFFFGCCLLWFDLLTVFYTCPMYYLLQFKLFRFARIFFSCGFNIRLQIPSSSSFFNCSWWRTFLRYADSIVFLIKKIVTEVQSATEHYACFSSDIVCIRLYYWTLNHLMKKTTFRCRLFAVGVGLYFLSESNSQK